MNTIFTITVVVYVVVFQLQLLRQYNINNNQFLYHLSRIFFSLSII